MKNLSVIFLLGVFVLILEKRLFLYLMVKIMNFLYEFCKYVIIIIKVVINIIFINNDILK